MVHNPNIVQFRSMEDSGGTFARLGPVRAVLFERAHGRCNVRSATTEQFSTQR